MIDQTNDAHFLLEDIEKKKDEYLIWARSKVLELDGKRFRSWMLERRGEFIPGATAWFFNYYKENQYVIFDSAINIDLFIVDGINYQDLFPYVKEHEAWESFFKILIRLKKIDPTMDTHKIAMQKEYEFAAKDKKHHRLKEYMDRIGGDSGEYIEAYKKVID